MPILPFSGLAKFYSPQPVVERVLREGGQGRQEAGQGQLLVPGPGLVQYVRQRILSPAAETV